MKLIIKFNLAFLFIFGLGLAVVGYISNDLLQRNARDEIVQNARIMMESALAARSYTSTQVRPLLETQMKYAFLPQSVPAYSATEQFNALRKTYPDYAYKEATLNPTNPRDRATDWEADIVNQFRLGSSAKEIIGTRDTPTGPALYLARPIEIKDPACIYCHDTPETAPKTLIERYGPANGFGWKVNEIVGAQIVSVPTTVPIRKADEAFRVFMISLASVLGVLFVLLNLMLMAMVVRPVTRLAKLADEVSLGKLDAPDFASKGSDEIALLGQSLNRMKKSLTEAMRLLET
jgi:protein-histidine pros-kinase